LDASILGSGSIVARAATAGMLDELKVMLVPVTLGGGKRLFDGNPRAISWRREGVRQLSNGNGFVRYRPG
jgi:dihydrofolate reductase